MNKRVFGAEGEKIAAKYLIENGFNILEMNFRSGKIGEIDIIASEKEYICFIEVKTRTCNLYGTPAEAVGYEKQKRIKALAWIYIKNKNRNPNMRFDVVEVTGKIRNNEFTPENVNLIRSAF